MTTLHTRPQATRLATVLGAIVLGLGLGAASAGAAQLAPAASASFECRGGQGYIEVLIDDGDGDENTFHISIDDEQVTEPAVSAGTHEFGPYPSGAYVVEVFWTNLETVIYTSDPLTFVCVADTVPVTDPAPETTGIGSGTGTIPETGQGSVTLLVSAGLLLASGVALVAVRRRGTPA